jgi:hypothetical protein
MKVLTKTVVKKSTGLYITGKVSVSMWRGGKGLIEMTPQYISNTKDLTKSLLLSCVNDGKFGVESIDSVELHFDLVFDDGTREYLRHISLDKEQCARYQNLFCRGI